MERSTSGEKTTQTWPKRFAHVFFGQELPVDLFLFSLNAHPNIPVSKSFGLGSNCCCPHVIGYSYNLEHYRATIPNGRRIMYDFRYCSWCLKVPDIPDLSVVSQAQSLRYRWYLNCVIQLVFVLCPYRPPRSEQRWN